MISNKSYSNFIALNPDKKYTYDKCINDFLKHKSEIKKGSIIKSFDCLKRSKNKYT